MDNEFSGFFPDCVSCSSGLRLLDPRVVKRWFPNGESHWEIKGRFRKRVVLANLPSFRFSFRGNIRRNHPFGKPPFCQHPKGSLGDKRAVSKRVVLANVPSFRFSFRGNIRRNHPFGNHPFRFPRESSLVRRAKSRNPSQPQCYLCFTLFQPLFDISF